MIPQELKKMFGLKDEKDLGMANNIWKMLDDMAESDPEQYKKFVQKNVKEGMVDANKKQEEKEKPYRIKPKPGFCLTMTATVNERPLQADLNQQVLITKQPWSSVRAKFHNNIRIALNVTYSDRIKELKSRSTKKTIDRFTIQDLKDIQFFYYSFQGPQIDKEQNQFDFCMILNSQFFSDLMNQNGGKKILMGLCISYMQERLTADKNPLLRHYDPNEFRRLAFYNVDKYSIQISEKQFKYGEHLQPIDFLLEKEVDKKRQVELSKEKEKKEAEVKPKKTEIIFKQAQKEEPVIPEIKLSSEAPQNSKKVLIEVLKEEQTEQNYEISYTMKESESGYSLQFLLPGVNSIKEVDLEMKRDCIQLKSKNKKDLCIGLKRPIDQSTIKAKFKKGQNLLRVEAKYS